MKMASAKALSIISIGIASVALAVSFLSWRESRLANQMRIEPYLEVGPTMSKKPGLAEFVIWNFGDIRIKDVIMQWAAYSKAGLQRSRKYSLADSLGQNEIDQFTIDITKDAEPVEESMGKAPDKKDIDLAQDASCLLGMKIEFRRVSDSKLFAMLKYFVLIPTESGFHIIRPQGEANEAYRHMKDIVDSELTGRFADKNGGRW
jgi:hypothetical protein